MFFKRFKANVAVFIVAEDLGEFDELLLLNEVLAAMIQDGVTNYLLLGLVLKLSCSGLFAYGQIEFG